MGLFSRKKKSGRGIHVRGFPGDVDTCKCLYLAAEKGVQMDVELVDVTDREHENAAFRALSPFGKVPCLGEGDLVISGAAAILPYLDIRGSGPSLTPKKAARLGDQNYWIEVGQYRVLPHVQKLVDECVLKPMVAPGYAPDLVQIDKAVNAIEPVFSVADEFLEGKDYFAGEYSFAEIHWAPYLHFWVMTGQEQRLDAHPNLKRWFDRIRSRESHGRNTYSVLPSLKQVQGKELRYVA